jgi:DNA ligase-1
MPGLFEDRIENLKKLCPAMGTHVQLVGQVELQSMVEMHTELDRVLAAGGEGLMLRQPKSKYEGKRSSTLLKVSFTHIRQQNMWCPCVFANFFSSR